MAFGNTVEIVGNVARDPELKTVGAKGTALATFAVAHNYKQGDEERVSFFDVVCWQKLAENVADSVSKGDRVVVSGRLEQQTWETEDGSKRSRVQIVADEVAPSLRWASADVTKNPRDDQGTPVPNEPSTGDAGDGAEGDGDYNAGEEPF